jgi:type II secretory pathway component PulF
VPEFAYVARSLSGQKLTGTLVANSEREAIAQLGAQSLFPIQIKASQSSGGLRRKRVGGQQMAQVYAQLSALLRSGVPMLRGLTILSQQARNPNLKSVLDEVRSKVEEGESLGDCMARYPRVFNPMAVNMVKAGAEGGFLEDALQRVSQFIQDQEDLKGKTLGALSYPLVILSIGLLVVGGLLTFFVPKFEELFATMREQGTLPATTEWLLAFSALLQQFWWLMLLAVIGLAVGLYQFFQTERGQWVRDRVKIKVPLLGSVFLSLAVARFCRVLGTLLVNGVPILRSLEISRNSAGNLVLSQAIEQASENITAGSSLAQPLASSGHFPPSVVEMIAVAEESNSLDTVLIQIADNLEKTTFRRLEMVVRLLEPLMLVVLAAFVMFVVLALMVPLLTSASTM